MNKKQYSPAPVYYTIDRPNGECRIGGGIVAEPVDGNIYKANDHALSFYGAINLTDKETGVVSAERATIKSAEGFGNNIPLAYEALRHWRKMGFKGSPASAASFTREEFRRSKNRGEIISKCNASANNMIRDYFTGGWIETAVTGDFHSPVYHYDINKAYLHAAKQGLPSALDPYNGDPNAKGYVVLMEIENDPEELPNFLAPFMDDKLSLVTSEDVKTYGLRGKIKRGVQYYDLDVDLSPILDSLKMKLPEKLWKRCTQSFWGMFCSSSGLDVEDFNTHNERKMWNRNQNIIWASLIVRRVAQQVFRVWREFDGISCFVDSVFTTQPINPDLISDDVGDWKLEGFYKKGIYFAGAGVWHPLPFTGNARFNDPGTWKKHAGFTAMQKKHKY